MRRRHASSRAAARQQTKKRADLATRLRRAEKSARSTKWALSGAGAKRRPPSPERGKHLEQKLARKLAIVRQVRAERDAVKK